MTKGSLPTQIKAEILDFQYWKMHCYNMHPSYPLYAVYEENNILKYGFIVDTIAQMFSNKWKRMFDALYEEYSVLSDYAETVERNRTDTSHEAITDTSETVKNISKNSTASSDRNEATTEFDQNSENKTKERNDTSSDSSSISEERIDENQSNSSSNTSINKSSNDNGHTDAVTSNSVYGYNSNTEAPADKTTEQSGTITSTISDETDESTDTTSSNGSQTLSRSETQSHSLTSNESESNSSTKESKLNKTATDTISGTSTEGHTDNISRNTSKEGGDDTHESITKTGRRTSAQELIMKELELRKANLVLEMFNDVDSILCLQVW